MIFEKIRDLVAKQFVVDANTLSRDTSFTDDLNADSLDVVELSMTIEELFELREISEDDLKEISRIERAGIEYSEDNWNGWLKTRQAFVQWDRDYLRIAEYDNEDDTPMVTKYRGDKRLIIGHTEMRNHKPYVSKKYSLVNVDTGAGSFGRLTLMDIDSGKTWQSRKSMKLYGYCSIG